MKSHLTYQPHVDGLRALAVALVVLCHLNIGAFSGGYIGVDVFFVISGYLISKLIMGELQRSDDFRFANFYLRRARRILPALLFTCAWTLAVASVLFSPPHLDEAGASALHAVASLSNVYFWLTSDYFALASEMQPFLHTWSLAVEEQFYLVWPLLLLVAWKVRGLKGVACSIALAFVFSLLLSVVFTDTSALNLEDFPEWLRNLFLDSNSMTYYLTPFRVFEFAAGAAVIAVEKRPVAVWLSNLAAACGLAMIVYAALHFDAATPFPHYNALLPVLGTVLLIAYGATSLLHYVLDNKVVSGLGKLSYSLYLVHWPVIVFYGYIYGNRFRGLDITYILAITFLLSYVTYRFVETPLRQANEKNIGFMFGLFASATVVMLLGANIWATNGWSWRLSSEVQKTSQAFQSREDIDRLYAGGSNCPYVYEKGYGPFCQTNPNARKHVWLMGDSHARHLAFGLAKIFPDINFKFYKNNCRFNTIELCYDIGAGIVDFHIQNKANILKRLKQDDSPVIIAQTWIRDRSTYVASNSKSPIVLADRASHVKFVHENLKEMAKELKASNPGRRIIVFGDVPRPRLPASASPVDCLLYPLARMREGCASANISATDERREFNEQLALLFPKLNQLDVIFINPFDALCTELECTNVRNGTEPLYTDNSHLSTWGSHFLVKGQYKKLRYALRDYMAEKSYYAK